MIMCQVNTDIGAKIFDIQLPENTSPASFLFVVPWLRCNTLHFYIEYTIKLNPHVVRFVWSFSKIPWKLALVNHTKSWHEDPAIPALARVKFSRYLECRIHRSAWIMTPRALCIVTFSMFMVGPEHWAVWRATTRWADRCPGPTVLLNLG